MRLNHFYALLATISLLAVPSVLRAAPYASNVQVTGTTVNFLLNEPSDTLTYSINGGAPVALSGATKGLKTFNLNLATDTFSIVADDTDATGFTIATGASINAEIRGLSRPSNLSGFNVISDEASPLTRFNSPRGVSVSKDPNAPNFGTAYVGNSAGGTTGGRTLGDGMYAIRADGSDAFAYGDTAQNPLFGGIPTFIASASSPYRVTVASDGQVYVADWADANSNVWVMDQALVASQNVLDGFDGTSGTTFPVLPPGQNHGSVAAVYVEGSLATSNLVVYTLDEDLNTAQTTGNGTDPLDDRNSLWRYNIGAGPEPWSTMPTKVASPLIGFVATSVTVDLDRGADGKFYMMQNRFNGLESGLFVTDAAGAPLWNSLTASRQIPLPTTGLFLGNPADYNQNGAVDSADYVLWRKSVQPLINEVDITPAAGQTNAADYTAWRARVGFLNDILTNAFAIAVSPDQKWLALMTNRSDVAVIPLINGIPDLANYKLVDTTLADTEFTGRDIAFDAAGNIHYVSSGQGRYRQLSPGGHTVATTAWNGSSYTFNITTSGSGLGGGDAVPEPGTIVLVIVGLLLGGASGRRRR